MNLISDVSEFVKALFLYQLIADSLYQIAYSLEIMRDLS